MVHAVQYSKATVRKAPNIGNVSELGIAAKI
jgi:hypothetical protein